MDRCLFCVMHTLPEGNHAFDPANLCPKHLAVTGIPEYLAAHPDGECTETCGCFTLAGLNRILDAPDPTDPPVQTLTYLARGIPVIETATEPTGGRAPGDPDV